jgi:hypothetical protein
MEARRSSIAPGDEGRAVFVHAEDGGEVHGIVNSGGGIVFVCESCHKVWTGVWGPEPGLHRIGSQDPAADLKAAKRLRPEWFGEEQYKCQDTETPGG